MTGAHKAEASRRMRRSERGHVMPARSILCSMISVLLVVSILVLPLPQLYGGPGAGPGRYAMAALADTAAYPTAVLADAPAAYWRLDEQTGTAVTDSSGHSYNGTVSGGVTLGVPGAHAGDPATAMSFNGASGRITTTFVQQNVSVYSLEAWVNTLSTGELPVVQDRGPNGANAGSLSLTIGFNGVQGAHPGTVNFGVDSDNVWIGGYTTQRVNDGQWHHIVGVFNGSAGRAVTPVQMTVYIDGQIAPTVTAVMGRATPPLSGFEGTKIGRHDAWNIWYQGGLQDVAIYPTALLARKSKRTIRLSFRPVRGLLTVSPTSGSIGQTVTLTGTTFAPNETVNMYADSTSTVAQIHPTPAQMGPYSPDDGRAGRSMARTR